MCDLRLGRGVDLRSRLVHGLVVADLHFQMVLGLLHEVLATHKDIADIELVASVGLRTFELILVLASVAPLASAVLGGRHLVPFSPMALLPRLAGSLLA